MEHINISSSNDYPKKGQINIIENELEICCAVPIGFRFTPYSIADAIKMREWLDDFIEIEQTNQDSWVETTPHY